MSTLIATHSARQQILQETVHAAANMLQTNLFCGSHVHDRLKNVRCEKPLPGHPTDLTRIPVCPQALPPASTKNPFCGCPQTIDECWDCFTPGAIETRILRPPQVCLKPSCNYAIPAMSCQEPCKPYVNIYDNFDNLITDAFDPLA